MSGPLLEVEGLGKAYPRPAGRWWRRSPAGPPGGDVLVDDEDDDLDEDDGATGFAGAASTATREWGLRDVSFSVPRGAIVAVIGPTGSGKSTLVRLLARLTAPTAGRAVAHGRVAPPVEALSVLLHADSDGRANVRLLARYLRVPRDTVEDRLEDILAFADLGRIDRTKLRRWPSAAAHRLTFAAAVGLGPDLLLADDRLGVGDHAYRSRCLDLLVDARAAGMSVLFGTHDLSLVQGFADHVIRLDEGRIVAEGPPAAIIPRYEEDLHGAPPDRVRPAAAERPVAIERVALLDGDGEPVAGFAPDEIAEVAIEVLVGREGLHLRCALGFDLPGRRDKVLHPGLPAEAPGRYLVRCRFPAGDLVPGRYGAHAVVYGLRRGHPIADREMRTFPLKIEEQPGVDEAGPPPPLGQLNREARWTIEPLPDAALALAERRAGPASE